MCRQRLLCQGPDFAYFIDGPKALNCGIQEARVARVSQTPDSIVGGGRPMVFCSGFRDVFSLISLLLLGMMLYVVVAFPPDGRCLRVWDRMGGGVGLETDSAPLAGLDHHI